MLAEHDRHSVYPCRCAFGLIIKGLKPLKAWRIVTTNDRVAVEMNDKRCRHRKKSFVMTTWTGGSWRTLVGFTIGLWLLQSCVQCFLKSSLKGCAQCQLWLTVPKNVPQRNGKDLQIS